MTGGVTVNTIPFHVRAMQEEDVAEVTEIDREAFPGMFSPPNFRRELRNSLTRYLVAVSEGAYLKGYHVAIWKRLWPWYHPNPKGLRVVGFSGFWLISQEAHVMSIAVRSDYQRLGIGEALFIAMIEGAISLGARTLTLEVRASNVAAQSLYNKYGLKEVGVRRGYYVEYHEDAIVMSVDNLSEPEYGAFLEERRREYLSRHPFNPFCPGKKEV